MTQPTVDQPAAAAAADLSLLQRVVGVVVSPQATFTAIVARPKVLGVLALTTVVFAVAYFAFLSTDIGRQAFVDQQIQQIERGAGTVTPQQIQQTENMAPYMRYIVPGSMFVIGPIFVLLIAGILYGVFAAMMGGGGTYKQVLAVVTHAGVVSTLSGLGVLVLNYVRQTMSSATNLAVFVQMLPEDSFLVRFLGTIDLVWVWYLIVLAIGLGVLYRRKAGSIAWTFLGLYLVIALIIAGARSAMGGS